MPVYNPGDIAVINAIIDNNGLKWEKVPEDGSYIPDDWGIKDMYCTGVKWSIDEMNKRMLRKTLNIFYGDNQHPKLTLTGNNGLWKAPADFGEDGNVSFNENTVISYSAKTLTSNDNSVTLTGFTVQTGLEDMELSGTLTIRYKEL